MITLKEWMELADYKITEGSDYGWNCYGPYSHQLDSWNGVHGKGGYSFSIVFSTKSQKVYEVQIHDYTNDRAYRMINPKFQEKHRKESLSRGVNLNEAWDGVDYVDLEVDDDFIQKCLAIKAGKEYSTDISVPLDLPDDLLMFAFKAAHAENMTFNAWMNKMLASFVDKVNKGEYNKEDAQDWLKQNNLPKFPTDYKIVDYKIVDDDSTED
jgi:hypothetical protein